MAVNSISFFDDVDSENAEVDDEPNISKVLVGNLAYVSDAVFLKHWNRIYKFIMHKDGNWSSNHD